MNVSIFRAPRSGALYALLVGLLCLPCLAHAQATPPESAAPAPPPAAPAQPGQPAYAPPAQPPAAQPGQPSYAPQAQPYQAQPGQPYQAQPGQPYQPPGQGYQAQPGQPYQAQPGQPYYQAQPGQPYYQGQPGQPYQAQPPAPRARRPRASPGMMISGIALLGATYMVGAITGAILLDVDSCHNCQELGTYLLIPVAGPFLAMGPADRGRAFLALFGLAQTAGAALMIGGIVRYVRSKKRAEEAAYAFKLSPRHTLSVDVATSPYLAGPQLSLRF